VGRAVLIGALVVLRAIGAGATEHGEETAPTGEEKRFAWDLRWAGWNGLEYELRQRVEVGGPDRVIPYRLIEDHIGLKGKIGGKLAIDGAAFSTSGSLPDIDNGFEVRRARLYTDSVRRSGRPRSRTSDVPARSARSRARQASG
jgi:hypothetical protein